jgi:hypothetical protein
LQKVLLKAEILTLISYIIARSYNFILTDSRDKEQLKLQSKVAFNQDDRVLPRVKGTDIVVRIPDRLITV